jgi:hypothetical protein
MDKQTYQFRLRGDHKIIAVLDIEAETVGEAFAEARRIARQTSGVTQIHHGQGTYTA